MNTTPSIHVLDIHFLEETEVIACFLIKSETGLVLIETGPETAFKNLKTAIAQEGFDWRDVKQVLLTHIHFDHAGAAWKFAENGAQIYVHPIGLPHLNHPERLWNSAKRIYKDDMDRLWGQMKSINSALLHPADDGAILNIGELEFKVIYTPGHAVHHNAYQLGENIFTGDVAGVKIFDGPVVPPCPPPDIHLPDWERSIQKLKDLHPQKLYLTHFGPVEHPQEHLDHLLLILHQWADWIKPYYDKGASAEEITPLFVEFTQNQLREMQVDEENIQRYEKANPSFMSVTGLLRYWKLVEQGRIVR